MRVYRCYDEMTFCRSGITEQLGFILSSYRCFEGGIWICVFLCWLFIIVYRLAAAISSVPTHRLLGVDEGSSSL